jgi:MFS family permease
VNPPPSAAPEPDSSRKGWTVAGALFVMLGIVITGRNSLGLMMPFWKQDLGWSYGFVATAGAVMLTVMAVVAPAGGVLLDRFGARAVYATGMTLIGVAFIACSFMTEPWHLIALFSVLGGAGFGVISPALVSATVAGYFQTRVGLATSIAGSGSTGGQLALMPLLGLMVVSFTWRPSFLALGIAVLATALVVQFLIRDTSGRGRAGRGHTGGTLRPNLRRLAHDRTFWLLAGGFFICGFTTAGVIKIHLIPYAVTCGFPPLEGATAYGVLSFFSMVGMIGYGYLADRVNRPLLLTSIYFMRALTFILLMQIAGSQTALFTFAILFGLFDYATFPVLASLVASHIGRHIMGLTMGLIFAGHSLGGAAGSFMGGYLFDLYARYDWVWIVSVGLAVLAGLMSALIIESRPGATAPAPA